MQCCTYFILCDVADPPAVILPALSTIEQEEPISKSEPLGHSLKDDISEVLGQATNPIEISTIISGISDEQQFHLCCHHYKPSSIHHFPMTSMNSCNHSLKKKPWLVHSASIDGCFCLPCDFLCGTAAVKVFW